MKRWMSYTALLVGLLSIGLTTPLGEAAEVSKDRTVRLILATIKAFRTLYVEHILLQINKAGVQPKEDWSKDDHAIMLPFQFVKLAGVQIKRESKNLEVGLVSLTPIYASNFPKTPAEVEALKTMMADPTQTVLTFTDRDQFKGLAADVAIQQVCADCHNHHPDSPKRDFKKGDLMGAIVVRLRN